MVDKFDIFCVAEVAIDEIANTGNITDSVSSTLLHSIRRCYGGMGGNFAVAAKLFNARVGILASVGKNDPDSIDYKNHLEKIGVDTTHVLQEDWSSIPKCYIINEREKQRLFFYPGTAISEAEKYLEYAKNVIPKIDSESLYVGFTDFELNKFYLSRSKARINAYAPAHNTHRHSEKDFSDCLKFTDVLFVNENEAEIMEKTLDMNISKIAEAFDIGIIVKTLGKDGSEIIIEGSPIPIIPCRTNRVVDPSGAGDAFAGAFMANYVKCGDAIFSAKMASAVASFVVEEVGCQTGLPTEEELRKRVIENYGNILSKPQ